jgi:hypothetical protein
MNTLVKHISIVSTLGLMALGTATYANAQTMRGYSMDQPRVKQADVDWKFDPNRHERRRHKDDRFRFYFSGFWYPEPYWMGYGLAINPRVSCGEGRAIVRDRGFYRVRTVECRGRTYTYLGRRHGDAFRVLVSSRSGRIVDVDPI